MWAALLKFIGIVRRFADWLEAKAGGQAAVDVAVAEGSRPLGLGKSLIVVLVLSPLAAPWLEAVGFAGASDAAQQVADFFSGEDGGMEYGHVCVAVVLAAFGLRRS